MKVQLCPVCGGNGLVPQGFYSTTRKEDGTLYWTSGGINLETCRGCEGKGWVEVAESIPNYNPNYYKKSGYDFADRCPSCGQNKNMPALTGCPRGSHYGIQS